MAKQFNITGTCFPDEHYMADVSGKMQIVREMIEAGHYFIINRPRQYGKTTTLYTLSDILRKTGEYIVLNTSFEGMGDAVFTDEATFSKGFVRRLTKYAAAYAPDLKDWLRQSAMNMNSLDDVDELISELVEKAGQKVVLMIDEVDKSSNNQLFVSFLAMLRNKYLERTPFMQSY
jgi:hypothetical protein